MNSGFLKTPTLLTVAVGAGVMIGAAGVFLYEHLIKEKRRLILQQDVMRLGMSVTELRRELEELREAQMARRRSRRATREEHNSTASVPESDVDMMSTVDDEDEFFDFSDAEDYPYGRGVGPAEKTLPRCLRPTEGVQLLGTRASRRLESKLGSSVSHKWDLKTQVFEFELIPSDQVDDPIVVLNFINDLSPPTNINTNVNATTSHIPTTISANQALCCNNVTASAEVSTAGRKKNAAALEFVKERQKEDRHFKHLELELQGKRLRLEEGTLALQRETLQLEKEKFEFEKRKFELEKVEREQRLAVEVAERRERIIAETEQRSLRSLIQDVLNRKAVVSRDWHELKRDSPENKGYKHIDEKLSNPDLSVKMDAYDELKRLQTVNQNDPEILWRLAKVCHGIGVIKGITDGLDVKKTYIDEAVSHASDCLERAPRSAEAHKWYAITVGSRGEFQPTKNKIKDGFVFKEHIEEALKISPNDPTLLHLLGRFRYEVATLSWVERKVANAVFGEVPYSTFPEALEALLRVEDLNKDPWKENRLMVAKCYINMGEFSEAVVWLDKALAVDARSLEEVRMQAEIQELLEKYERYRNKDKDKRKPKKS